MRAFDILHMLEFIDESITIENMIAEFQSEELTNIYNNEAHKNFVDFFNRLDNDQKEQVAKKILYELTKRKEVKLDYEDDIWDYLPVQKIAKELAEKYDGRCFVDYDMNERVEAFRFFKDETGINIHIIGCSDCIHYNHIEHDDYDTEGVHNTYSLSEINMVEEEDSLVKEITQEQFDKMLAFVEDQKVRNEEEQKRIKDFQKEIGVYPENY